MLSSGSCRQRQTAKEAANELSAQLAQERLKMKHRRRTQKRLESSTTVEGASEVGDAETHKVEPREDASHSRRTADARTTKKFADELELASHVLLSAVRERDQLQESYL